MLHLLVGDPHLRHLLPDELESNLQLMPLLNLLDHLLEVLNISFLVKELLDCLLDHFHFDHCLVSLIHHLPQEVPVRPELLQEVAYIALGPAVLLCYLVLWIFQY
jgi:hypothetical protein